VPLKDHSDQLITAAERVLIDGSWAQRGDTIVIVSGLPGGAGGTNRILVHRIGESIGG
jgi:pyruvate kinase